MDSDVFSFTTNSQIINPAPERNGENQPKWGSWILPCTNHKEKIPIPSLPHLHLIQKLLFLPFCCHTSTFSFCSAQHISSLPSFHVIFLWNQTPSFAQHRCVTKIERVCKVWSSAVRSLNQRSVTVSDQTNQVTVFSLTWIGKKKKKKIRWRLPKWKVCPFGPHSSSVLACKCF